MRLFLLLHLLFAALPSQATRVTDVIAVTELQAAFTADPALAKVWLGIFETEAHRESVLGMMQFRLNKMFSQGRVTDILVTLRKYKRAFP